MHKYCWLTIFLIFFTGILRSQDLAFEKVSTEHGLNHNSVNCFLNCSSGYLWIGTFEGLNRYDGYNMFSYKWDEKDSTSLSNNFVECLYEDREGNIWIGTQNGLNRFIPESENFQRYLPTEDKNSVSFNIIKDIYQDQKGVLWLATYGGGLTGYDNSTKTFTRYSNKWIDQPTGDFMNVIYEDHHKQLWIGTWMGGLLKFDRSTGSFKQFIHPDKTLNVHKINTINTILEQQPGILWLGTWEYGIKTFNTQTEQFGEISFHRESSQLNNSIIRAIQALNNNELLVATFGNGMFYIKPGNPSGRQVEHINSNHYDPQGLGGNTIWDLYIDKSGLCWIATWGDGMQKIDFNKNKFISYFPSPHKNNWLTHNFITAICEIKHPQYLIGTIDGGYYLFDKNKEKFNAYNTVKMDGFARGITRIVRGSENIFWVGTRNGLYRHDINRNNIEAYTHDIHGVNISGNEITAILTDKNQNVWIGVRGAGIDKLVPSGQEGKFSLVRYWSDEANPNSLSSNTVTDIFEDHHGTIWVATLSGGVNIYNPLNDNFRVLVPADKQRGIEIIDILTISESNNGNIWLGTLSNGIWKYNNQTEDFKSYSREDGLSDNSVYRIFEDDNSNLWLSTGNGLTRFNPVSEKFNNYQRKNGLHDNSHNYDIYSAFISTSNKEMIFGGKNGFTLFNPVLITENPFVPNVTINRMLINGDYIEYNVPVNNRIILPKPLHLMDKVVLTPSEQIVTLEFASLHFASPESNLYEYTLEGYDNGWIRTDATRRFATYTGLPSGNYTFKVRASNSDGVWHPGSQASIRIQVKPPFWKSLWFLLLLCIPIIAVIFHLRRVRFRHLFLEKEIQSKLQEAQTILSEKQIYKLEQEKLSLELDRKNKELASTAVVMSQKNERLKKLKDYLGEVIPHSPENIRGNLNQLKEILDDELATGEDWENFERNFDIMYDDFMKRFTHDFPRITHKDLKMVSYIRMNYSNKEIADLLGISLRSLESSRYRLRKKMDLPNDINLNDFIIRY